MNGLRNVLLGALLLVPTVLDAGDWPQILGPHRNGKAASDEQLLNEWPASGPAEVWSRPVGHAFAGVAVAGPRVILFHREGEQEVTECLNAADGQSVWKQGHATTFYPQVGGGDGPLCVPVISGDRVVTFGAQGVLSCFRLASGERLWMRKTHEDFRALEGYFGAGSSPIVVDRLVIVNVGGGRQEAGVVAFDLQTGETRWTQTQEPAGYSAPVLVAFEDRSYVLMVTRYKCVLLDAETGAIGFEFPFGQRGPTVNGASPVVIDNAKLFVTASYGVGAAYAQFSRQHFDMLWQRDDVLSAQYCTPIYEDGILYGIDGREDVPPADLKAVELKTGKRLWIEPSFGYGTLISADGKLLIQKTDGDLILGKASPEGFRKLAHHRVLNGEVRALPALANGRFYVRNDRVLKCFQVGR